MNGDLEARKAANKDALTGIGAALAKTGIIATATIAGGPAAGLAAGFAAELVGVVIPNFKQERYDKFAAGLEGRISALEGEAKSRASERMRSEEFADLFEDATRQAVRALSEERIHQLQSLLINGLTDDEIGHARRKRLLELFGATNDIEILILQGYALRPPEARKYWNDHPELFSDPVSFGNAQQEEIDNYHVVSSYRQHLIDLGLLRVTYSKPLRDKNPEFDFNTGRLKASATVISNIGRVLVHEIGLEEPFRESPSG